MSWNRFNGAVKKGGGELKKAAGKITGDKKLEAEGELDTAVGGVQNAVGKIEDKARETLKR